MEDPFTGPSWSHLDAGSREALVQRIVVATSWFQEGRPDGAQPADAASQGEASASVIGESERGAHGFGLKVETSRLEVDADGGPVSRGQAPRRPPSAQRGETARNTTPTAEWTLMHELRTSD